MSGRTCGGMADLLLQHDAVRQLTLFIFLILHTYISRTPIPAPRHLFALRDNKDQSMSTNWPETTKELSAELRNLRSGASDVMKAFSAIAQAAVAPKALDTKTKELIALAVSVAIRCDDCIAFHSKAAVNQGATREEVLETLGMAIYMGAGPSVMYASHALEAATQFENERARTQG
jgi:AhpD family alkylhydroperoxidase